MYSVTIVGVCTVLFLIYFLIKWRFAYWRRKGMPYIEPSIPYGNFGEMGIKYHSSEMYQHFYNQMKGKTKIFGLYLLHHPVAVITDSELINRVLIKDFNNFVNRGIFYNERDDPLSAHLVAIEDDKWRTLRSKFTPTFTSGKMKYMYSTFIQVADQLKSKMDSILKDEPGKICDVEIKDLMARFTTDIIGVCAFGIECNSLKNPDAEFRNMGREIFTSSRKKFLKMLFINNLPELSNFLRLRRNPIHIASFFMETIRETVEFRQKTNTKRNDFMDLLINLLNTNTNDGITLEELSAEAYAFFLGGFETSSTALAFAIYELAKNPHIQQRAREEINTVLEKHNDDFNYEAMLEMTYLKQIINGKYFYMRLYN